MRKFSVRLAAQLAPALALTAASLPAAAFEPGDQPRFMLGNPVTTHYDGVTNDLLTAGLGKSGLGLATPPAVSS
ncbi:MAG: hypothetical protein JO110_08830, partial [Acetobacteraceae bacterium]|nr:hypothetical protein [Acetobacteraceae bacterium]